jgi:hypothetical protein
MAIRDRIKEDFQRLTSTTDERVWNEEFIYRRRSASTVDPETGDVTNVDLSIPLQAVRSKYIPEELAIQKEFITLGIVTFFIDAEELGMEPHKDDYATIGGVDYSLYSWQLDNDLNVYRLFLRVIN